MFRFRLLILATIVWLIFALNMERPNNILNLRNINLDPLIYVVLLVTMITVFLIPQPSKVLLATDMTILIPIYFGLRVGAELQKPAAILTDPVTYIELAMILITFWLARMLSLSLFSFENAIDEKVLGAPGVDMQSMVFDEQAINDELLRARRYNYSVALFHVRFEDLHALKTTLMGRWNRKALLESRYLRSHIVYLVRELLVDNTDIVVWHDDNLVLCLPEKTRLEALGTARKLSELFEVVLGVKIAIGIAVFPEDALVCSDMLRVAESTIESVGKLERIQTDFKAPVGFAIKADKRQPVQAEKLASSR